MTPMIRFGRIAVGLAILALTLLLTGNALGLEYSIIVGAALGSAVLLVPIPRDEGYPGERIHQPWLRWLLENGVFAVVVIGAFQLGFPPVLTVLPALLVTWLVVRVLVYGVSIRQLLGPGTAIIVVCFFGAIATKRVDVVNGALVGVSMIAMEVVDSIRQSARESEEDSRPYVPGPNPAQRHPTPASAAPPAL